MNLCVTVKLNFGNEESLDLTQQMAGRNKTTKDSGTEMEMMAGRDELEFRASFISG
jgi:hypothetical protein